MEGRSHYSEKHHTSFIARFKGKIAMMDKSGHFGVAASSNKPIEKSQQRYTEIYKPYAFNPYSSVDQSSIPSTLPSSRMSSDESTSSVLGSRYKKYYTPVGMGHGTGDLETFSRACDFFGANHRKSCNDQYAGINPLYFQEKGSTPASLPRHNMQKVGVMSLKDTPRYASHGKIYAGYKVVAETMPTSTTAVSKQKKYASYIAQPHVYTKEEYLLMNSMASDKPQHYNYAKNGTYIVSQPNLSNLPQPSLRYYK